MVTRFACIGNVVKIHEVHSSRQTGQESVILTMDAGNGEMFPILLTGKLLSLVAEEKIREGDKVYVEGKLRKDRTLTAEPPKMIVVLFASFLSVIA